MPIARFSLASLLMVTSLAACSGADAHSAPTPPSSAPEAGAASSILTLADTTLTAEIEATGTAAAVREATLSTKLMATVTSVDVLAGTRVRRGQALLRLDHRELAAKRTQVDANREAARAGYTQATAHASRIRALFADDAAPKAMLDAAEAQLTQAESALRAADAAAAELEAVESYATITAPFDGMVTLRHVDPGALAAPGMPLLSLQDPTRLRVTVHVAPSAVRNLQPGAEVQLHIEGQPARGIVEGIVPAQAGLYAVNAIVENADGRFPAGGSAAVAIPVGSYRGIALPDAALVREGDLVGVTVRDADGDRRRWIRIRPIAEGTVEVLAGLRAGDRVVLPTAGGVE